MARSKWTVMFIPHDNENVRSVHVSSSGVRAIVSGAIVLALMFAVVTTGFFVKQGQQMRTAQLERENALLAAEVTGMRLEMESLANSVNDLAAKDARYRVIAGLPAIAEDVRRVGIGGPGTKTVESLDISQYNPELGEQLFAASYDLGTLLRRAALLRTSMGEALTTLSANTERLEATPSISPSSGPLSSLFSKNRRHPVLRISRPHQGIDIAARVGEPISAPAKGRVIYSGNRAGGYGMTVELDHGFGYVTRFAHASRLLVRVGETVERGQTIAEVGTTGLVSGPHLHYEVEVNGQAVDPLNFIITDDAIPD
jgi:murein DD-endopeptidase MepM/ murein hydrolase activator NlpD